MKTTLSTLLMLSLAFSWLFGCMSGYQRSTIGVPLDRGKVAQIQQGVTTLKEVLAWFGPPDFIIDGTQRMPDTRSMGAAYGANPVSPTLFFGTTPIRPRLLTSPEGTVILIYISAELFNRFVLGGNRSQTGISPLGSTFLFGRPAFPGRTRRNSAASISSLKRSLPRTRHRFTLSRISCSRAGSN